MGKRMKGRIRRGKSEKTVDLGLEKSYRIETPKDCGLLIGKAHGIGARSKQQDSFGISEMGGDSVWEKGVLAVLADGMGGMSDGEKASMAAVISCLNYFETHDTGEAVIERLIEMAENANQEVKEVLGGSSGASGSTLIVVLVKEKELFWLSIGDSRLYLYRDGELQQLSKDHNYAAILQEKVEAGEMTQEEAENDPQKNALTSYIGINLLDEIDHGQEGFTLFGGDRVLLMSDGIYNTLTEDEIVESMKYSVGKSMMHLEMQVKGKRKKNQDNYTAVLLEIE